MLINQLLIKKQVLKHILPFCEPSKENFELVLEHGLEICQEYERRYSKIHDSFYVLSQIQESTYRPISCQNQEFSQFLPKQYYHSSAIEAYRNYYSQEKIAVASYSLPSEPPCWLWEKLLPQYSVEVGKIVDGKIKISQKFWSDLFSFLTIKNSNKKEIPILEIFLSLGFGTSQSLSLPERITGKILSNFERKFYQFQFLISYCCERDMLPGYLFIGGKNSRLKKSKEKKIIKKDFFSGYIYYI